MPQGEVVAPYTIGEDGRIVHTMRQSWINDLDTCPEKARRAMVGQLDRWETDAAAVGTACHAAIEECLVQVRDYDSPMLFENAYELARFVFDDIAAMDNFKWIQVTTHIAAYELIHRCLHAWYTELLPDLCPQQTEIEFGPLVIYEDEKRVVQVTGTMDYLDAITGIGDWKTSGSAYKPWEKERWAVQPTFYTWAGVQLGLVEPDADGNVPFTFYVLIKQGSVRTQKVTVQRHAGDWAWLQQKLLAVALLIEADASSWPLNDTHALCSGRWCSAWTSCKGANFTDTWPKPSKAAVELRANDGRILVP